MLSSDHPLAIELWTLRTNLHKYKEESHTAWLKLQQETESNEALRSKYTHLDDENIALRGELQSLGGFHAASQSPSSANQEQLDVLTHSLTQTQSALVTAQQTTSNAYELLARSRTSEEEVRMRAREMETMWRKEHEEKKLIELVVNEYATLVRNMTSVKSRASTSSVMSSSGGANPMDAITQGKAGISKLFDEFTKEVGHLEGQLAGVRLERDRLKAELEAERKGTVATANELAKARTEVMKVKDNIERYMQFSQSTLRYNTDLIDSLRAQLDLAESREMRIRQAFQNVTLDLARESAGRREEIKMRIKAMVPSRGGTSSHSHDPSSPPFTVTNSDLNDEKKPIDEEEDTTGRIIAAESAVHMLLGELERETERRIQLEKAMAYQTWEVDGPEEPSENGVDGLENEVDGEEETLENGVEGVVVNGYAPDTPREMKDLSLVPQPDSDRPPSPPVRSPITEGVANGEAVTTPRVNRAEKNTAFLDEWDREIDALNGPSVVVDALTGESSQYVPTQEGGEVITNETNEASTPVASPTPTTAPAATEQAPGPPSPVVDPPSLPLDHAAPSTLLLSQSNQPEDDVQPLAQLETLSSPLAPASPSLLHAQSASLSPSSSPSPQVLTPSDPTSHQAHVEIPQPPHTTLPDPSSLLFASSPENPLEPLES
ncbi:hypothetical protein BDV98DRAFT_597674, partial [Pterulicium gracile]